jgi:hypothetical protein
MPEKLRPDPDEGTTAALAWCQEESDAARAARVLAWRV